MPVSARSEDHPLQNEPSLPRASLLLLLLLLLLLPDLLSRGSNTHISQRGEEETEEEEEEEEEVVQELSVGPDSILDVFICQQLLLHL